MQSFANYHTDGTQLIVAAGHRVHVYDVADGDLIQFLKGKDFAQK